MKKIIILLLTLSLCSQSMILTKAEDVTDDVSVRTYQALEGIDKYVESKPIQTISITKSVNLPVRYDAREDGLVTTVKNQGEFGICWAYTVASVAETQFLKKGYANHPDEIDVNELQMAYGFYHRQNDPLNLTPQDQVTAYGNGGEADYLSVGGNHQLSSFYLAQWASMAYEEDFPNTNRYRDLPDHLADDYDYDNASLIMTNAMYLPDDDVQAIKEAIYQYGSVATSYYSENEYDNPYLFHDDQGKSVNHSVTLVGWDDSISKESFIDSNDDGLLPSCDGAWIMKNSWGTTAGDGGYFYLSYDMRLESTTVFEFEKRDKYHNNYFYDGGYAIMIDNPYGMSDLKMANIFTAQKASSDNKESLTAVSVGIASTNTQYSIQIYRLKDDYKNPNDGTALLAKPITGTVKYPGSYTIELSEAIELIENEHFAVEVTLKGSNPAIYTATNYDYTGFLSGSDQCEEGQSYVSYGWGWSDMYKIREDEGLHSVARIRAYTNEERISAELNQLKQLIEETESYQQDEDYALFTDLQKEEFQNAIDTAKHQANDLTLSNEAYQQAYDSLRSIYDAYQQEVSQIKTIKQTLQTLLDEIDAWQNDEDITVLPQVKIDALNIQLQEVEAALSKPHTKAEYDEYLSNLQTTFNELKTYIQENKAHLEALNQSITTLSDFLFSNEIAYLEEDQIQLIQDRMTSSENVSNQRKEDLYLSEITSNETILQQSQQIIEAARLVQNQLLSLYEEVILFQNDEQAYLLANEQSALEELLEQTYEIMDNIHPKDDYLTQQNTLQNYYEALINNVEARKQQEQIDLDLAKSLLKSSIEQYENTDLTIYTLASQAFYHEAYEYAKAVYEQANRTIDEVNEAYLQLEAAKNELQLQPTPPTSVRDLSISMVDYKTVQLSWSPIENATSYDIYRKSYKENATFEYFKTVDMNQCEISSLMSGKSYSFYVVAKNDVGEASASNLVQMATQLEGKPTLTIKKVSKTKFTLNWSAIDGATRYIVYRKRGSDPWKKVLTLGGNVYTYTTSEMPQGDYCFIVKAGRYDSKDRIMTPSSNTVQETSTYDIPQITLTTANKNVNMKWNQIEGIKYYEVYRATAKEGKYTKLKTTTSTSYIAKSLTVNKTYYFKVRGYKSYNNGIDTKKVYSEYSEVRSIKVK